MPKVKNKIIDINFTKIVGWKYSFSIFICTYLLYKIMDFVMTFHTCI
jgi:hypothetical protein